MKEHHPYVLGVVLYKITKIKWTIKWRKEEDTTEEDEIDWREGKQNLKSKMVGICWDCGSEYRKRKLYV